jgi:hypothetical protein
MNLVKCTLLMFILSTAFVPGAAFSQSKKIAVYIEATSPDSVGQQLVYEMREKIDSSSHLAEADSDAKSFFQLRIVTLDPGTTGGYGQQFTVYSVVLTGTPLDGRSGLFYLDQWVGTCGSTRVTECAAQIIAGADADMTPIVQSLRAGSQSIGK